MILNLNIELIKNPEENDYIFFDLKNNGISSFGSGKTITFKNATVPTSATTWSQIQSTLSGTVSTLLAKLQGYNTGTTDSSTIGYTVDTLYTITAEYITDMAIPSGYTSTIYSSYPEIGTTFNFDSFIPVSATTSGLLMANSPYWVTYTNTDDFDIVKMDLRIWTGNLIGQSAGGDKPDIPSFQFTKYKTRQSDITVGYNINNFIKSYLNPKLNDKWGGSGTTLNNVFDETVWVEWVTYGGKDILDLDGNSTGDIELVSSLADRKIATLGYGYFEEGANNEQINPLTTLSKFNTLGNPEYTTTGNTSATATTYTINRVKVADRGTCQDYNNVYQIVYLNKAGVFEGFSFPKLSRKNISSKSTTYNRLLSQPFNYSPTEHTTKVLNKSEKLTYTLNTDLLKQDDVDKVKELIQSDKHYLYLANTLEIIPVVLKDENFEVKNTINNRARIQYTLQFDAANEVKNNII